MPGDRTRLDHVRMDDTRAAIVARRRATIALFATAALMNAAMAAVSPASTIYASSYLGVTWSAAPQAVSILGTGTGALLVARLTSRLGWRASLALGYGAATGGAVLSFVSALLANVPLLCIGMLILGWGVGGAVISRYAAAELYPAHRRGFAIGVVVGAGSVGAIGGPLLLTPVSAVMRAFGWPELSGPFLLAAVVAGLASTGLVTLPAGRARPAQQNQREIRTLLRTPTSRTLLIVMLTGQLVMVAIMTAAPMDIHMRHGDLTLVGTALAAHTTGMFVLSPVTGWIIDRIGSRPVMFAGLAVLVAAAAVAATAPDTNRLLGDLALFLLGYGWNLCFMSGSRTLAVTLPPHQGQMVGSVDAVVWSVSATATLAGTALLSMGGYGMLAEVAGSLPVITAVFLARTKSLAALRTVVQAGPGEPGEERPADQAA